MSEMAPLQFLEKAQQIQKKLQQKYDDGCVPFGASMGFVYGRCRGGDALSDFILQADHQLYKVKGAGKGAVMGTAFTANE